MNASIEKYLIAYNLVQLTGWLLALIILPVNFIFSIFIVAFFQFISLLEIVHAHQKWTQSSPVLCFIQIGARLFILFFTIKILFISIFNPIANFYKIVCLMLTTWCIAEIIRCTYYLSQLIKKEKHIITWLRYSAFMVLYPIGVACEFLIMYLVFINNNLAMKIILIVVAIAYMFIFPKLYLHLLKQRKQKLYTVN